MSTISNVGALIPLRTGASRLPGKPLLDVAGKTALERVAARANACSWVKQVVIATTNDPIDDELARFSGEHGFGVYRGSVDDVLARLAAAARAHGFDVVVEVDGDDLLCATEYMNLGVDVLLAEAADLVHFEGLPIGATPNILRTSALERAVALKKHEDTSTGFFRFLIESGDFKIVNPCADNAGHRHDKVRMTLDYPEDLAFFRAVYRELDQLGEWTFSDLVALLSRRPDLVELNQGLNEAYQAHFQAGLRR